MVFFEGWNWYQPMRRHIIVHKWTSLWESFLETRLACDQLEGVVVFRVASFSLWQVPHDLNVYLSEISWCMCQCNYLTFLYLLQYLVVLTCPILYRADHVISEVLERCRRGICVACFVHYCKYSVTIFCLCFTSRNWNYLFSCELRFECYPLEHLLACFFEISSSLLMCGICILVVWIKYSCLRGEWLRIMRVHLTGKVVYN